MTREIVALAGLERSIFTMPSPEVVAFGSVTVVVCPAPAPDCTLTEPWVDPAAAAVVWTVADVPASLAAMLPTLIVVPLNVVDVLAAKLPTATVVCVALSVNEISALPVAST